MPCVPAYLAQALIAPQAATWPTPKLPRIAYKTFHHFKIIVSEQLGRKVRTCVFFLVISQYVNYCFSDPFPLKTTETWDLGLGV